jgi:hypothetical protein
VTSILEDDMKKKIGVAGLVALLALGATAPAALAQCGGQLLMKFDADCFAYESNATLSVLEGGSGAWKSNAGSALTVVGLMTLFCAPLNANVPNLPTTEYSFVWSGMTAAAATTELPLGLTGKRWTTDYTPGNFYIYEDSPADAPRATTPMPGTLVGTDPPNATVPVNFQDGTLILDGTLSNLTAIVTRSNNTASAIWGGSFSGLYQFTGGTQYGLVAGSGINALNGNWCGRYPSGCTPPGYTAHPNGKFDFAVTEVTSSTWGAIKQLYR